MGHAHILGMVRSRTQGIDRLVNDIRQKVGPKKLTAIVIHSGLKDEAKELGQRLTAEFKRHEVYITEVSAVVATHIGPKSMGIAFCAED